MKSVDDRRKAQKHRRRRSSLSMATKDVASFVRGHKDVYEKSISLGGKKKKGKGVQIDSIRTSMKPYKGDLFGSGAGKTDGLLYLSRMKPREDDEKKKKKKARMRSRAASPRGGDGAGDGGDGGADGAPTLTINTSAGDGGGDGGGSGGGGGMGGGERGGGAETPGSPDDRARERRRLRKEREQREAAEISAREKDPRIVTNRNYAAALCSISWGDLSNRKRVVDKGATSAVGLLAGGACSRGAGFCACALANLASEPTLHRRMLDEGVVSTLVGLTTAPVATRDCKEDSIAALCRLSSQAGQEEALVTGGVLPVMLAQNTAGSHNVVRMCAVTLLNLSCMTKNFERNEYVLEAIKTVIEFLKVHNAMREDHVTEALCMRALCNLSAHREYQGRVVEEGAVRVLTKLWKSEGHEIRYLCASVLASLTRNKATRRTMADQRAAQALIALADAERLAEETGAADDFVMSDQEKREALAAGGVGMAVDAEHAKQLARKTQLCCLVALCRLSACDEIREAIVRDHGVRALVGMVTLAHPRAEPLAAETLWNLSSSVQSRLLMLGQEGVIELVVRLSEHKNPRTQCHCALTMANWLMVESAHESLLAHGAVAALINLCRGDDERARMFSAQALYNLSCSEESCLKLAEQGASRALIVTLANAGSGARETRKMCAAALGNLTKQEECQPGGSDDASDAIPALIKLLGPAHAEFAITALFNLCSNERNCAAVVDAGGLGALRELAMNGSEKIGSFVSSLLSRLSYFKVRRNILDDGLVPAVMRLCEIPDLRTQNRCLAVLCNLANEGAMRERLVETGAVRTLVSMCASYDEAIRRGCAAAICNLATEEVRCVPALLEAATVPGLVVLGLVASHSVETQRFCTTSLFNLMQSSKPEELQRVLKDGAVWAVGALPRPNDPSTPMDKETAHMSAIAICNMSANHAAHEHLMGPGLLKALLALTESPVVPTQRTCAKALYNLATVPDNHQALARAGIIPVLHRLVLQEDLEMAVVSTLALCCLSASPASVQRIVNEGAVEVVVAPKFSVDPDTDEEGADELQEARSIALYHLSWHEDTRCFLIDHGGIQSLGTMVRPSAAAPRPFVSPSLNRPNLTPICVVHPPSLCCPHQIRESSDPSVLTICVQALYNMSHASENLFPMVREGVVGVLAEVLALGGDLLSDYMRQMVAHTIFNLSTRLENQSDMVEQGAAGMCAELWNQKRPVLTPVAPGQPSAITLFIDTWEVVARTLLNFANGKVNSARLLRDGAGTVITTFILSPDTWMTTADLEAEPKAAAADAQKDDGPLDAEAVIRTQMATGRKAALGRLPRPLCAAALRNLLCPPGTQKQMVTKHNALDAIVQLASTRRVDASTKGDCATSLLIISASKSLRELVSANPAAKKLISASLHDSGRAKQGSLESMIDPTLLSEIEQESFKMGAAKMQQLGRAHPQCMPALRTDLRLSMGNAPPLHVDVRQIPWSRLDVDYSMKELVSRWQPACAPRGRAAACASSAVLPSTDPPPPNPSVMLLRAMPAAGYVRSPITLICRRRCPMATCRRSRRRPRTPRSAPRSRTWIYRPTS
jgi:hypothetical protein